MKNKAGVWVDHQAAVIVELAETGAQLRRIQSNVEKPPRRSPAPPGVSIAVGETPTDTSREREYQAHLARYYDEIISHLRAADEVLIFGPGEAKIELKKRFAKVQKNGLPMPALETTDKMTVPQMVAHVRQHFHHAPPRGRLPAGAVPKPSTRVYYYA
jgi:hypothetical protein